jgi:putative Mn2+ efflux pump MntP
MFEGQKTRIFWVGLVILGLASISLFSILWYTIIATPFYYGAEYWKYLTPPIVGAVVFILIGLYMMKSGAKKREEGKTQLLNK